MNKVFAFDSWMQYAHHFQGLAEVLYQNDFELYLLHIGSWGHDPNRSKEEKLGKLTIRDITFYDGLSFYEILKSEKPIAVIFLSMQPFAHRAFNRYCVALDIPTLHMYHGVVSVQDEGMKFDLDLKSHMQLAISRINKNVTRIWPTYIRSLIFTKASLVDWFWFIKTIAKQLVAKSYSGGAPPDAKTNVCSVYTEADVNHAVHRYGLEPSNVIPVGNPDLYFFGVENSDIGLFTKSIPESGDVLYIDSAFIDYGMVYSGAAGFVDHLVSTKVALKRQGYNLIVKLHPAHFRTGVYELLDQEGFEIVDKESFMIKLRTCCACIVEPSSLALIPALMALPLYIAQYGPLVNQAYGKVLITYPRTVHLKDLSLFSVMQNKILQSLNETELNKWIEFNVGPLPSNKISERLVAIIKSLNGKH